MAITPGQIDDMTYQSNILKKGRMGFSGCDITATIRLPAYQLGGQAVFNKEKVFAIGTLQTISISTYNAKSPVKAVGFKNPIAVARGGRTIAGTLIFNQLHHHVFDENNWPSMTSVVDDGFLTYSSGSADYFTGGDFQVKEGATEEEVEQKSKEYFKKNIIKEKLLKQWDFSWDTNLMGERSKPSDMPPFDIIILMVNELGQVGKIILYGVDLVHDSQTLSVEDIYTEAQYQYVARDIEYFHAVNFDDSYEWQSKIVDYTTIGAGQVTGTADVAAGAPVVLPGVADSTTAAPVDLINPTIAPPTAEPASQIPGATVVTIPGNSNTDASKLDAVQRAILQSNRVIDDSLLEGTMVSDRAPSPPASPGQMYVQRP